MKSIREDWNFLHLCSAGEDTIYHVIHYKTKQLLCRPSKVEAGWLDNGFRFYSYNDILQQLFKEKHV